MLIYFTWFKKEETRKIECDALDIQTTKYDIRVRGSGILIKDKETQKELDNIEINLL